MMRRILTLAVAAATLTSVAAGADDLAGTWTARIPKDKPGKIHFSLQTGINTQYGLTFDRASFPGLTREQIESPTRVPVEFALERDAGTIRFDGTFRDDRGSGDFTFDTDPDYLERLRSAGVRLGKDRHERDLLQLALFDVSIEFIRSMKAIGYDVSLDKYIAFRIFGVDPAYVREMGKVGFDDLSADRLVETRIHGATPEYIREMRANGEDLSLNDYIQSRIFQVTPGFADEIARAGYPNVSRDLLVQFRIHGVTPEFIAELREMGYSRLSAQKLVELRIHGVTPEFIRRVEKAGYRNVPVDKLVQMRIFDIDPEMVRALDDKDGR